MKTAAALGILLLSSVCFADRLVNVPIAKPMPHNLVRTETIWGSGDRPNTTYFDFGVAPGFDTTFRLESAWQSGTKASLDLSYNLSVPFTDIAPGFSVGVQDIADETKLGTRVYFAVMHKFGNYGEQNQDTPTEVTYGIWTASGGSAFVALSLPFTNRFRAIAEHDSRTLMAGIDLRPMKGVSAKWLFRDGRPEIGLSYSHRF
jgi:hypothetical protein